MSICVRIFILVVSITEIYCCMFNPFSILYSSWDQLSVPNDVSYNISITEGFPSFQVYSPKTGKVNDDDMFEYYFSIENENGTSQNITAIDCHEFVLKYVDVEFVQD